MKRTLLFVIMLFIWTAKDALAGGQAGSDCPYCHGSTEIMQRAGLISHGPFGYLGTTTAEVEKHLAYVKEVYWLESTHFKIFFSLPTYQVPERYKKRYFAELSELQTLLPAVNPKTLILDPWLRIHLYAYRAEKLYKKFLEIINLNDTDFPETRQAGGKYMGEGIYLGQKGKFELFMISAKAPYADALKTYTGAQHDHPQRWNFLKTDSLWFGLHTVDDQLNQDLNLYSAIAHNLGHCFVDGFKHYSYDLPVWFTEGFAHYFERLVFDEYTSYCFTESYQDYKRDGGNWAGEVRRRLGTGGVPSMAELVRKKSFSDIDQFEHMVVWSMVDFMVKTDKKKFAEFLDRMKGRINEQGLPDTSNLADAQRIAIKEIYGVAYPQFESNWRAFVAKEYAIK